MCGIVGVATKQNSGFTSAEGDMFRDMLYLDAFRGWDSTGVFGVDKQGNVQIHKEASDASSFIKTKEFKEFKTGIVQRGVFAVGHNRAATRGDVVDKNAHPFNIDNKIVLVQNGTWYGDHKKIKDTEVDTEALAHVISENADIEVALGKIQAAYSLCWFNTETNCLYLVRNNARPLWLAETMSGTVVWASEPGFIQLAAMRNQITLKEKPELLDEHILVKFELKNNSWVRTQQKVSPFRNVKEYIWEEEGEGDPFNHTRLHHWKHGPWNNHSTRPTVVPDNHTMVKKQFIEEAFALIPDVECPSSTIAAQCQAAWRERVVSKKKCVVELQDYLAANDHKECTTWHVCGYSLEATGDVAEYAIIHWFLYNKTEKEVMDYVTHGFYEFEPAHTNKEGFAGKTEIVTVIANPSTIVKIEMAQESVMQ